MNKKLTVMLGKPSHIKILVDGTDVAIVPCPEKDKNAIAVSLDEDTHTAKFGMARILNTAVSSYHYTVGPQTFQVQVQEKPKELKGVAIAAFLSLNKQPNPHTPKKRGPRKGANGSAPTPAVTVEAKEEDFATV